MIAKSKNIVIKTDDVLIKEKESLVKFIEKHRNKCNIEDALNTYMLVTGTAGQLVLAAVKLGNLFYANCFREILDSITEKDFLKEEK